MATKLPKGFLDAIGRELECLTPSVATPIACHFRKESGAKQHLLTHYYNGVEYHKWLNATGLDRTADLEQRATFLMFILAAEGVL